MILLCSSFVFCGEFEDTLSKAEQGDTTAQFIIALMYDDQSNCEKTFFWMKKAAEQGVFAAQTSIGDMYYRGHCIQKNYKQAIYWFKKAIEQKNIIGTGFNKIYHSTVYQLGKLYYEGKGVPKDDRKAIYWYKKAAEQGDVLAQNNLAIMYANGEGVTQDYKQAFFWFKKAAEQGNALAQYNLGVMYFKGQGVPQDYKQAFFWYKKAAEQGDVLAQYNLAIMYANGEGVTQDYKQAVYWYKKSAEQGYAGAQYNLGNMYYNGQGTTQNYKLAYVWESLAAAQGHESATKNRNITAKKLTPQQLSQAQELAATIQYKIDHPSKSQKQQPSISNTEKKINGSGTGFIITRDGYILTCYHVIKDANEIKISTGGNIYSAKLIRKDANNDLALLKINGSFQAIAFSSKRSARMGQEVFTIGYPNPSLQGVSAKFTKGTINSLTGFQDDLRLYQVSVPVQPGNSGGALVDNNGNILGVIMAMLSAKTAFKISGSLPQNVNYAVKGTYAQAILDTLPEISNKLPNPSKTKSNAVERVKASTVMVLSYE